MTRAFRFLPSLLLVALTACSVNGDTNTQATPYDDEFPVSDHTALFEGVPDNSTLPDDYKADTVYPAQFSEPRQWDSPIRSQGRRGVCSIFSTVGYMESLYNKEGSYPGMDFSEQYLQWSAKFQVGAFPNSSGSNAGSNLEAIHDYGIVKEEHAPYENEQWGITDDPECDGNDEQPTRCYTNGDPSEAAQAARKWTLPRGRWVSRSANTIKGHMVEDNTGVIVGLTFFYQSWNHRASTLPVNSDYWREGYVTYPNQADEDKSLEKRAGHSILLVGWDDELEVQSRDGEGNLLVDDEGNPVMEKGFYLFKNSWGTGSFGVNNPHGDGYGWISMDYVHEYASAYVAGLPEIGQVDEDCGDKLDNDDNGATDCEDAACADALECQQNITTAVYESVEQLEIPDNDPVGIAAEIVIEDEITIGGLEVSVDITHTYRGDLRVTLYRDETAIVLQDKQGGSADDLVATFTVADFNETSAAGTWRLKVEDRAAQDVGMLNSWSMEVTYQP